MIPIVSVNTVPCDVVFNDWKTGKEIATWSFGQGQIHLQVPDRKHGVRLYDEEYRVIKVHWEYITREDDGYIEGIIVTVEVEKSQHKEKQNEKVYQIPRFRGW